MGNHLGKGVVHNALGLVEGAGLTEAEARVLHKTFRELSMKNPGRPTISREDLQEALRKHNVPLAQSDVLTKRLYEVYAKDQGGVDWKSFCAAMALLVKGNAEDKVKLSFQLFDLHGEGTISRQDLVIMLTKLGHHLDSVTPATHDTKSSSDQVTEYVDSVFAQYSADKQHLTQEEYFKAVTAHPALLA